MSPESVAQRNFELNNSVQSVCEGAEGSPVVTPLVLTKGRAPLLSRSGQVDDVFKYNKQEQQELLKQKPWRNDPHHFKRVRISAVALIKMVMHARSGGQYEIMGLMQGKLDGDTFVVMDAFALPVVGTETRVNAANEANEFMIQYIESSPAVSRPSRWPRGAYSFAHSACPFYLFFFSFSSRHRSEDLKTSSDGTTLTRATAAGYLGSTS